MDGMGTMVIQNLDSLWFFSNVMVSINNPQTPPPQPPPSKISDCLHRDSRLNRLIEAGCTQPYPCENRETVSPPPISTIPNEKHNNITISNKNNTIMSNSPSTPKTTTTKFEQPNDETPPSPATTTTTTRDEGRSSKRMRSKKQGWNNIREIRREIKSKNKVDWDENDDDHDRVVEIIPPYKDDDAMKKHLRSWAVVVAYTAVHNTRSNPFMVAACS